MRAGKHVLQEKPAANSVDAVNLAIKEYCTNLKPMHNDQLPVWALAENYRSAPESAKQCLPSDTVQLQSDGKAWVCRSEQGFRKACQLIPQLGTIIKVGALSIVYVDITCALM